MIKYRCFIAVWLSLVFAYLDGLWPHPTIVYALIVVAKPQHGYALDISCVGGKEPLVNTLLQKEMFLTF